MEIVVKNIDVNENKNELVNAIANIPTEKLEEFVGNVIDVASQYNKTFESDKEQLRCGVQVAPKRKKDCLLNVYGAGSLYSFEASKIANNVKFSLYSCPAGSVITNVVESEEMEQLFDNFLRENVENYDDLLQEEVKRIEKAKNEEELVR